MAQPAMPYGGQEPGRILNERLVFVVRLDNEDVVTWANSSRSRGSGLEIGVIESGILLSEFGPSSGNDRFGLRSR